MPNRQSNTSGRLLLIDGLNLVRRVYAACERNSQRHLLQQTAARCTQTLHRLLQQHRPSHALSVFDGEQANWRSLCYPAYKANRSPMPDELRQGLDQIQDAFWQLGVDSLLSREDEADDLIATLSDKAASRVEVIIVSTDHGYGQLLTPQITQWDCFSRQFLDQHFYQQRYGVRPVLLPLFTALVGSSSHNIKGIAGIGSKTAAALLQNYPSIEALLGAEDIPDKIAIKLRNGADTLATNYRILQFRKEIPLGFSMRDIRYQGEKYE